ncbi:metal ABC transporter substrate-binding protein [Wenjunlia vitaminophila]|uniref:Lipoprotein n=1 Tax=Wenjunlia vitaminophila TaxID=76728 RepID=A0A0T6LX66_WENVI|nr:MetQ/NlpA family ABC transporter substrate-binding protein [Wenjunlia vitaminophila]KRV50316.1 metal ABC transporter substrate-binding protein [Wenjunlia vitaminophila]
MRNTVKISAVALAAGALVVSLSACGSDAGSGSGSGDALVVAATPVPHADILRYVKDNLAEDAGLRIEIREFTDYVQPNTATQNGDVDANFFQHRPYLDDFNEEHHTSIVRVADVHLEPLGLYSKEVASVEGLNRGATIAVPNDATNEGRALALLAEHGVLTLKDGVGQNATPRDIVDNPRDLKFEELEAAQLPRSLDDVDASVINGNYALEAGLNPARDALVAEEAKDNPYANFLAVKRGKQDDPRVRKLAELLQSPGVRSYIEEEYSGAVVPAF